MNPKYLSLPIIALLISCGSEQQQANAATDPLQKQVDKLVFVEGGTFQMGDAGYTNTDGEFRYFTSSSRAKPAHSVTLSSYSIQAYEATYREFDAYTSAVGDELVGEEYRGEVFMQPDYPAKWMTWYQARGYCQWLGQRLGYSMDLPTEAQWEYAARSRGKAVAFATDNGLHERDRNMRDPVKVKHEMPVGSWPPNPLGIYDMTGNVDEWTMDWWYGYREEPRTDPNNHEAKKGIPGKTKLSRGGGIIGTVTVYRRKSIEPERTGAGVGVRCVVNHPEKILAPRQTVASNTREP